MVACWAPAVPLHPLALAQVALEEAQAVEALEVAAALVALEVGEPGEAVLAVEAARVRAQANRYS